MLMYVTSDPGPRCIELPFQLVVIVRRVLFPGAYMIMQIIIPFSVTAVFIDNYFLWIIDRSKLCWLSLAPQDS